MSKFHLRLLILLVLLATVVAVAWTTAGANPYRGRDPGVTYSRTSRPVAGPAIGEPDVGQTPGAPKKLDAGPAPAPPQLSGRDRLPKDWFIMAGRVWAAHHLGIRF